MGIKSNVVVLTSGLTGSSVLTGLISEAGYWTGDRTVKKKDYDTFENADLVSLNQRIFDAADFKEDYMTHFSPDALARMDSLSQETDTSEFRAFVEKCNQHGPWIWKDPRLWMTVHFWKDIVDLRSCKFIVLTRDLRQLWVSTLLRRQIVSYRASRAYEEHVRDSAIGFLDRNRLSYHVVRYEDVVVRPAPTIGRLNDYLGAELTVNDLKKVYHKPLYKLPASSPLDFAKALLIYAKNYSQRIDSDSGN
jgi:hypothetical protein